jgi:hypothetical protein
MIEVKISYKAGCVLYYVMHYQGNQYPGGIDKDFHLFVSDDCPFKELMLRSLINKCMDTFFARFTANDEWGVDLTPFVFKREGDIFVASARDLKLPSGCSCHK